MLFNTNTQSSFPSRCTCYSPFSTAKDLSVSNLWGRQDMAWDEGFPYLQKKINFLLNFWRDLKGPFGLIFNYFAEVSKAFANIPFFFKPPLTRLSPSERHQGARFSISQYFQILGKLNNSECGVGYQGLKELRFTTGRKWVGGEGWRRKTPAQQIFLHCKCKIICPSPCCKPIIPVLAPELVSSCAQPF